MESKKKVSTHEAQDKQNKADISRRNFLKRSAYSAPVLMVMGQLVKPQSLLASTPPPCPDDGFIPCG